MNTLNHNFKWLFATLLVLGLDVILGQGAGMQLMLNGHSASEPTIVCLAILCLSAGITGLGIYIPKRAPEAEIELTWVPNVIIAKNPDGTKDIHGVRKDGSMWSVRWNDLPELSPRH